MTSVLIKKGVSGFVEVRREEAKKYSEFESFYWIREYSVLLYLWPYETENIIKYKSSAFVTTADPDKHKIKPYYEIVFPRYHHTLEDYKIHKDSSIIQILLDIFSALKFLHSKRIMHRDLKPNNIMIDDILDSTNRSRPRAVLIDFSHSIRLRTEEIILDKFVCTYPYRAPEIYDYFHGKCETYDYKSDIWSVGIILFELITGKDIRLLAPSKEEEVFGEFVTEEKFNRAVIKEYEKKKRAFSWTDEYLKWIRLMLDKNPNKRISASDMYKLIYNFAKENNIRVIEPKNGDDIFVIPSFTPKFTRILPKHQELLTFGVQMSRIFKNRIDLQFTESSIRQVLQFLIKKETLDTDNIKNGTFATCIIIDASIYDNINELDACVERVKEYGITIDDTTACLKSIIRRHDKDLFLLNAFSFNGFISSNYIESRIANIKRSHVIKDTERPTIDSIGNLDEEIANKLPKTVKTAKHEKIRI